MASAGDFINKVVIITGAGSGIGRTTAILFAKEGASLVLCDRDEDGVKSTVNQCIDASGGHASRFTTAIGDVTKSEVRKAIVEKAVETFQQLDILVANAGISLREGGIMNTSEDVFDDVMNTNFKAVFFLIQTALPHLEKSAGNIVCLSSLASTLPTSNLNIYSISKAAVDHMTKCLAMELAPKGIRVNAVNPSYVDTNISRSFGDTLSRKILENEIPRQILHGQCVTTEAIANMIAFLASDKAKFITGQCHIVDGARHYCGSLSY